MAYGAADFARKMANMANLANHCRSPFFTAELPIRLDSLISTLYSLVMRHNMALGSDCKKEDEEDFRVEMDPTKK